MKNNTSGIRFGAVCLGLAVCVVGARCARAQNALGDGRALDRNLRQGSGGVNTQVRDLNAMIRFNNYVVTGNAVDGKAFRGNAGYLATEDFRAATGTDALFQFRRDATSSAMVAAGIRGTDALQYQFALSTGQAPPTMLGGFADFSGGINRGANPIHRPDIISSAEQRVVTGNTASSALRSTADYNSQQNLRPSVLGYRMERDGSQTVLTASPLLGVAWSPMAPPPGQIPPAGAQPPDDTRAPGAPVLTGLESVPSYVTSPVGLVQSMASARLNTRVESPQAVMTELKRAIGENASTRRPDPNAPVVENRPINPLEKPEDESNAPSWEREMDRIRKHLGGVPDDDDKKGQKDEILPGARPDEKNQPRGIKDLIEPTTGKINADVLKALQATRPTLVRLAPESPKEADTYAAHMSKGEALLSASKYFDAEDSFVRALALQAQDPLANVGRIHAQLGAGMFISAATNLKRLFSERPEMIGTRYAPSLMPPAPRAKTLAEQLRMHIKDPTSGIGKESGMLLAYLGYQANDAAIVKEGLEAMAQKTYPEQSADILLLGLFQKIWVEGRDLPPAPAPAPPPATPAPAATGDQNK